MSHWHVRAPLSHTLLFWTLSGIGTMTALPAFIVPPAESLQKLRNLLHAERVGLAALEHHTEQQRVLLEALRTDPQVNLRLAQRELRYVKSGEKQIHIPVTVGMPPPPDDLELVDQPLPELHWAQSFYPPRWAGLYRIPKVRHLILIMSLALIMFAATIYSPKS